MVLISDLMDIDLLKRMQDEHYVNARRHPTLPLTIYNYSAKAQYEWEWNEVTRQCRGLIVRDGGEVIARPFPKFFSIDQLKAAGIALPDEPFDVYEKVDGSLIVLYHHEDRWYAASRGSFVSDQAQWANMILERYAVCGFEPNPAVTYCFELIVPQNRIVVDYGRAERLVLLALFDTETGAEIPIEDAYLAEYREEVLFGWSEVVKIPPVAVRHWYRSVDELIDALETDPSFAGQEGFVLRYQSGLRVKVKSSEYLHLHRLVTRVTPRRIWECISEGMPIEKLTHGLWSEPAAWIAERYQRLQEQAQALKARAGLAYLEAVDAVKAEDGSVPRKDFALYVQRHESDIADLLFTLYDQKPITDKVWARLKPRGDEVFRPEGEDV